MDVKDMVLMEVVGGGELDWERAQELLKEMPGSDLTNELVDKALDFVSGTCYMGGFDPVGAVYEIMARRAERILGYAGGELFEVYSNYLDSSLYVRSSFDEEELTRAWDRLGWEEREFVKYVPAEAGVDVSEFEIET